jgi:hypothetical protein
MLLNAKMNPAAYPSKNTEELEALQTFERLLVVRFEKSDLKKLDTRPNTDGTIEIVDEEQLPLGKIEVQVRKIPDGETSYQCPIKLIAYSERISLPFILVCVDVGNNKAYFRHLHRSMMPELKPNQQSFVVKFDPKVHSISSETQYRLQWLEIIQEYNTRISDYARLRQIENQLNPLHISKEDRIYFQEYIDHLNHLLDFDFPVVKEQFFKDIWKLGVGVSSADQNDVIFQIYKIHPGDPFILVSGMPNHFTNSAAAQNRNIYQYNSRARSVLKSSKQEAESFVFDRLKEIIRAKKLSVCGKRLATEYLFWFVDHLGSSIGIEEADRLNVNELNYGISVYLPAWASLAVPRFLGELIRLNKNDVQAIAPVLAAPPFEHIANTIPADMLARLPPELHPRHQPTKNEVLDLIRSGGNLRPVRVCFHEASPQSLIEAVDFLLSTNQEWIERPYKPRTSDPDMIWSGYDVEALRHNMRTILVDSLDEYRMFVERNQIPLKNSFYLHQPTAIIYVANLTEWANAIGFANSPYLKRYIVKNEDNKIPKVTLIDTSEAQIDFNVEKQILKLRGVEREIIDGGDSSPDGLFDKRPILTRFYSMLQNDLESEFKHGFD